MHMHILKIDVCVYSTGINVVYIVYTDTSNSSASIVLVVYYTIYSIYIYIYKLILEYML